MTGNVRAASSRRRSLTGHKQIQRSLGVESGDDWTLDRIRKGYHSEDILEQCHKLDDAGIDYGMTFLNGVAGREHSHDHAVHIAEIFNQCHPVLVGIGGLTLFPGTPLLEETERGEFEPLSEREMLIELKTFVENLTCDCGMITHHTVGENLTGPDFLGRKESILDYAIEHGDMDRLAFINDAHRASGPSRTAHGNGWVCLAARPADATKRSA